MYFFYCYYCVHVHVHVCLFQSVSLFLINLYPCVSCLEAIFLVTINNNNNDDDDNNNDDDDNNKAYFQRKE